MTVSSPARIKTVLCLILGFAGCAQFPVAGDASARWFEVDDDVVTISIHDEDGISMEEFIRVGQIVTGKVFTYSSAEVGNLEHGIRLVGKLRVEREKFFAFFQTMLYINGFACVRSTKGATEIIAIKRLHDGRGDVVETVIEPIMLEHAACEDLQPLLTDLLNDRVRSKTARFKVAALPDMNVLVLAGDRDTITKAKDLIAQLDRPLK